MIGRKIADLVDSAFNRMAPVNIERRYVGADYLTNAEEHIDVWPAPNEPTRDELWAAETRRTATNVSDADLQLTITRVLRHCDSQWPNTTAGIITRELQHYYNITAKQ